MIPIACFDIETTAMPDGWRPGDELGITCAAMTISGDLKGIPPGAGLIKAWWAEFDSTQGALPAGTRGIAEAIRKGLVPVSERMSNEEVELMVTDLLNEMANFGCRHLFVHNGVGFDWPVIQWHMPDKKRKDWIREVALRSFDPWFQAVRTYGFPISLGALAQAMLGESKTMLGADAPEMWKSAPSQVIEYVGRDVELLDGVVRKIMEEKRYRWIKGNGEEGMKLVDPPNNVAPQFDSVKKLIRRKYARGAHEPNRDWMDNPEPFTLDNLCGWLDWRQYV